MVHLYTKRASTRMVIVKMCNRIFVAGSARVWLDWIFQDLEMEPDVLPDIFCVT